MRHIALALLLLWPFVARAELATADRHMVAAAHPLAAAAGRDILRAGGSAVDAAIATQLVLTLVEPQAAGIGGSAFIVHYDKAANRVITYDGRETAPEAAKPWMFLGSAGQPLPYDKAAMGGISVGVPGMLRAFELAYRAHGKLAWSDLFEPAIKLAEDGFRVSPRLGYSISANPALARDDEARDYFYMSGGVALSAGSPRRNLDLAAVLRRVARDGAGAFYSGEIAAGIVRAVQSGANPGSLTVADLAGYRAVVREPVCGPYRRWKVCSMGPPSSGGIAVLQILGMLERFDMAAAKPGEALGAHLLAEANRLAFADRDRYVADADFVPWPAGLLDRAYLAQRSRLITVQKAIGLALPGTPPERRGQLRFLPWPQYESTGTSQVSVVDAAGNAVSMTSSVGDAFGARLFTQGFILNNELSDFNASPMVNGEPVANRVEPGKRPRSSMAPTLVFDERGNLVLAVGSQGGPRIIGFVAKMLVAALDWNLDMQAAIDLPHILNRNGVTELEDGANRPALQQALQGLGHQVTLGPIDSGQQGIKVVNGKLTGGGDRRREGVALGD